ncbi:MAG: hypothetical protein OXT09_13820 [Myxococcales bacterium]|nr:hypothetical protein [Myxococcales bacterium]
MRLPWPSLLLSWLLLACAGPAEVELLSLERVEPRLVEPGAQLRVLGSGLPVGREGEVTLSGRVRRPGAPTREVSATAVGRALSEDELVLRLGAAAFAELGEHGTFEGELRLAFEAAEGNGRITGTLPATLDLVQPMARGPVHRHGLRERAREVLGFVGIVPAQSASTLAGLVIDWTRPGSEAERAGLVHGDVIVAAGGVTVHSLGDLAPAPNRSALRLQVRTPPQRDARPIALSLAGLDAPTIDISDQRLSIVLCFTLLCLLLLSPLPPPAAWFARWRERLRSAPPQRLRLWGGQRRAALPAGASLLARADRLARCVLWPAALSLAAVLVVLLEPAGVLRLRSLSIYLAFAAVSVGLSFLAETGSARARVRVAADVGFRMMVLVVLILCACALSGTRTFDGMVADQGAWPWQWALFRKPALLISFPLFLVFAARLGAATLALGDEHRPGAAARLLVAERVLTNVVLSAIAVAVYAGGWQSPPEIYLEQVPPRLTGAVLFVLKCWGFAAVLQLARRVELGARLRWPATAAVCAAVVVLTALDVYLDPSQALDLALGRGTLGAFAIAAWVGLVGLLLRGGRARPAAPSA